MSSNNSTTIPEILQFQLASQQIAIVLGLVLFIGGITGNLLNIVTFYMLGNWKHNASSLYILVKSLSDFINLYSGLLMAILQNGFQVDLSAKDFVWCKLRISTTIITFLISLNCVCFQSIDAFFCSSQSAALRRKSDIRMARYITIGSVFVWIVHMIPFYMFQNIIQKGNSLTCAGINSIYNQYLNYFVYICLYVVIPIPIISIFGYLTYRNLHISNTQGRRLLSSISRQMISMTFFQIGNLFLFQVPFGIILAYTFATSTSTKDSYHQAQDQVARTFALTFTYGTAAVNTYKFHYLKSIIFSF